jgi:methionyl-tRNA formyltransferase
MRERIVLATPHPRHDALEHELRAIPSLEVIRIRSSQDLSYDALRALEPRYIFFPHWSQRIPEEIYNRFECVIFHMTDVPFGRGGSPLQNLIVRGITKTKLTALRCAEAMDAGPVYMKRDLSLEGRAEEVLTRAGIVTGEMIKAIVAEHPEPAKQDGEVVTFSRRRPEDGNIASLANLTQLYDYIRMLDADGYPPAFLETEYFRLEFSYADLQPDQVEARVRITKRQK